MKLYDAIAAMESRRPITHGKHVTLDDFLIQLANDGDEIARKLLDAEELFLPTTERALRQLRHPKWRLIQFDLPPGVTGIVTDGIDTWKTDSSAPFELSAIYMLATPPQ